MFLFKTKIHSKNGSAKLCAWRDHVGPCLACLRRKGTRCSKQTQNLKFKWLQRDLNLQPLSSETTTELFSHTGQMIELCCEYLCVQSISLHLLIMSRTRFRMNLHFIVAWMSRNSLLETSAISEVLVSSKEFLNIQATMECKFTLIDSFFIYQILFRNTLYCI